MEDDKETDAFSETRTSKQLSVPEGQIMPQSRVICCAMHTCPAWQVSSLDRSKSEHPRALKSPNHEWAQA